MKMQDKYVNRKKTVYKLSVVAAFIGLAITPTAQAAMTGNCADCHTMHNSQDGQPMNFDLSPIPNDNLVRGTCLGCHAQGKGEAIEIVGVGRLPQVYHTGSTDLAAGNFAYITGFKGSGASDRKGHNIGELTGTDAVLYEPPGGMVFSFHDDGKNVNTDNLTCAGTNGCHGYRYADPGYEGITGAHHKNTDGQTAVATEPGNSYRFLMGVKGFEDPDWEEYGTSSAHNEYYALPEPVALGCTTSNCHADSTGVQPPDGTMSQYCATCHGNFHTLEIGNSDGIGAVASSPFIRHPTDLSLPSDGEYTDYTVYSVEAPVGRINGVPASSSPDVQGNAAVMCLSCHVSHASDYPSMLRWDYSTMIADGGVGGTGCFVCHTTKD